MRIILVRHGQTDHNVESRIMGWLPTPLNGVGRNQVEKLGSFIKKNYSVSKIYSSDLIRAKESSKILKEQIDGPTITFNENLREHKFGDWEGKLVSDLKLEDNFNRYSELFDENFHPPNGESVHEFKIRVLSVFQMLLEENKNITKCILIVAHGGTNRVILGEIFNLSFFKSQIIIKQSNACLNEIHYDFKTKNFSIFSLNNDSFLNF